MSERRSDNYCEEKGLICGETQTRNMDQISDNNCEVENEGPNEDIEDNCGLSLPSLLETKCSFPTELFHTLSPISLSQITSESTPIVTNRREPIGGEDRRQRRTLTAVQTVDANPEPVLLSPQAIDDRPPLIGQTNSSSDSNGSTGFSNSQKSDESVGVRVVTDVDRDALAAKVRQLLGRTGRQNRNEDFEDLDECESLGLIRVINETSDDIRSYATIGSERSEPDGKGKPYLGTQTQKIVYYSSSESEDNEEVEESSDSTATQTSNGSQKLISKSNQNFDNKSVRNRSYSASGRSGLKSSGFDISMFLRQRLQTKDISVKESSETQTNRSFLAEQAIHNEKLTRVKRTIDTSKAIQTSDSLLNIESSNDCKQTKESSCQTSNSLGISSFLRQLLKSRHNSTKVSAGTQTIRSYLTEQALKQKSKEQEKEMIRKTKFESKCIQSSYTSSRTSESNSPLIDNKCENFALNSSDTKEPISWFIPIVGKQTKAENLTKKYKTCNRSLVLKSKPKEHMSGSVGPEPLQEAFNRRCIDMRIQSQIRVNRIHTIADIRKRTADERLIEMAKQFIRQQESAKVIKTNIIQPVFKSSIRRFFTHEEMRAQTEKIYNNLPEVKAMREKKRDKERQKNQRLLAQIYKYRLKDNALKGRLTWKITQSCLN